MAVSAAWGIEKHGMHNCVGCLRLNGGVDKQTRQHQNAYEHLNFFHDGISFLLSFPIVRMLSVVTSERYPCSK
jgi:hypothetical protein